jgi:hypothetical protein
MDKDPLTQLHGLIAKELADLIKNGEATAAHFSAAITFLKNNGIDCDGMQNPETQSLAESMQFPVDVDSEDNVAVFKR